MSIINLNKAKWSNKASAIKAFARSNDYHKTRIFYWLRAHKFGQDIDFIAELLTTCRKHRPFSPVPSKNLEFNLWTNLSIKTRYNVELLKKVITDIDILNFFLEKEHSSDGLPLPWKEEELFENGSEYDIIHDRWLTLLEDWHIFISLMHVDVELAKKHHIVADASYAQLSRTQEEFDIKLLAELGPYGYEFIKTDHLFKNIKDVCKAIRENPYCHVCIFRHFRKLKKYVPAIYLFTLIKYINAQEHSEIFSGLERMFGKCVDKDWCDCYDCGNSEYEELHYALHGRRTQIKRLCQMHKCSLAEVADMLLPDLIERKPLPTHHDLGFKFE